MSTEIKNTLFRFKTMRAPELLEKDKVAKYFVQHPNAKQCFFDQYLNNPGLSGSKKQKLAEASIKWRDLPATFRTREDVKTFLEGISSNNNIYDFAIWLTANRSTLKKADLETKLKFDGDILRTNALATPLNTTKRIELWNNLIVSRLGDSSGNIRKNSKRSSELKIRRIFSGRRRQLLRQTAVSE